MNIIEISDESRFTGTCSEIISPLTSEKIKEIFKNSNGHNQFTLSGTRTGIVGGAVPLGGILITTEKLQDISIVENSQITVGAGVTVEKLRAALSKERTMYFAPNPTEETATIGGLFACNGAGGNSRKYGTVGDNTVAIEFVTATGMCWQIRRGDYKFDEKGCNLPDGNRLNCDVYQEATIIKALTPVLGMDLIDLISGSEGTLGTVTALTMQLQRKKEQWGILYFFEETQEAINYLEFLKKWDTEESGVIEECEFFCTKTLDLLEKKKSTTPSLMSFPLFPANSKSAISVILSGDNQDFLEDVLIKHFESFCSFGGKDINTWGFEGESEIAKLYTLRHAVPELINSEVDLNRLTMKDVTKIGTDFRADLSITEFSNDIKSHHLNGYIFGHGLDGHFHVNILVSSKQELLAAKNLILQWSTLVVERGGMLIEENGIGKLKAQLVQSFLAKDRLINMGKIKEFFDPSNLLTIGTIF